ncbi:MAG: 16S rRNA (uracil(1498)-N(3))-methyltransferase [Ferruginibacter sp.]|nr:16S rRNA (uracil(1498)-N(3))-methyltransferase [Ferruginibacter sp.]
MALPIFYKETISPAATELVLDEETSKHVAQVLRMQNGEQVQLTDGKGNLLIAEIADNNKKNCALKVISAAFQPAPDKKITIAISLVKNAHRFEWFLEKATEIGVYEIVPLLCSRTEKQHFRIARMNSILISAMLQSQQTWLPELHEPVKFTTFVKNINAGMDEKRFIAHCVDDDTRIPLYNYRSLDSSIVLIGPEGDFTIDEIELALQHNFVPVALGNSRLRTETAGVVAITLLSLA